MELLQIKAVIEHPDGIQVGELLTDGSRRNTSACADNSAGINDFKPAVLDKDSEDYSEDGDEDYD